MDTTQGHVWFHYLTDAYIQVGNFDVSTTWIDGKHQLQGVPGVTGKDEVVDAIAMPENWSQEWATLIGDTNYDVGSYGIGVPTNTRTISVPKVRRFHLMYLYLISGSKETRMLVQVPYTTSAAADLGTSGLGIVNDDTSPILFTTDAYANKFFGKGFNRFGTLYPAEMSPSRVDELRSFTGTFTDTNNATATYHVYFEPTYMGNARPLFDLVYMQTDLTDIDSDVAGIPSQLLRWRGGIASENTAPINRAGSALERDGYIYSVGANAVNPPQAQTLEVDGVHYTNADAYNLGYKRH